MDELSKYPKTVVEKFYDALKNYKTIKPLEDLALEGMTVKEFGNMATKNIVNLKRRGSVRRLQRMNMWRRTLLRSLFNWWILRRRGSVRRLLRMNMWRRMLLRSLFSWWILKRGSVKMRLWRMTIWRRTTLRRMLLKRLCKWLIFIRRDSLWRILRWGSKSGQCCV